MDSIKEEKSDGRQSQLEEADHEKPLEKPLIKRDVFIPFMVILITDMAIFHSQLFIGLNYFAESPAEWVDFVKTL
ncbi:hypothetical protein SUGI_1025610 [Cryptomeria japonica]|nr:hypothetical protein SUGI_1025610 [Cryptomeria japonica]